MNILRWIEGITCICGLALAFLIAMAPRFGPKSKRMLLLFFPASLSAGIQAFGPVFSNLSSVNLYIISFALIVLVAGGGYSACYALRQHTGRNYVVSAGMLSITLAALIFFTSPAFSAMPTIEDHIILGPVGYISAIFMLVLAVIVIANTEMIMRHSSETARWELKFLLLGIGTIYGTIIYLSSQTLLYPFLSGLLFTGAIHIFHILFLIACILTVVSWKRSSGKAHIVVSQSAVYSFITLLSVGAYLIASGALARMVGRWGDLGLPVEVLVFFIAIVGLASLLLATSFRHKTRAWIRHNVFSGKYDYRQSWIEAAERIRSIDPQEVTAQALVDIIKKAMGAVDISVWIRRWNPNRLQLLSITGNISATPGQEAFGVVEQLMDVAEPLSMKNLQNKENVAQTKEFMEHAQATLLVPLLSSNRIVGLITVGKDRSGRKYGREGREFLRVLAGHAAGEFHKSDLLATLVSAKEDEAFRAFSTFVLHDLKNFASTLSYIAQNASKYQNNPEFQKDAFQSVYETAEKMKRMCNSLRTFSGTLAADKKYTDLNQIIRAVADTLNVGLQERLKLELAELTQVFVDEEEVKRVLQNLLVNAREAITSDGVIFVRTLNHEDKIDVIVEDNGKGMNREFLEKELFMPFHTTKSSGLGIGLFHSKKIMEAHRGSISVESEEGNGTKIHLTFPVRKE